MLATFRRPLPVAIGSAARSAVLAPRPVPPVAPRVRPDEAAHLRRIEDQARRLVDALTQLDRAALPGHVKYAAGDLRHELDHGQPQAVAALAAFLVAALLDPYVRTEWTVPEHLGPLVAGIANELQAAGWMAAYVLPGGGVGIYHWPEVRNGR